MILEERSEIMELLDEYSKFLLEHGYLDTDFIFEPPTDKDKSTIDIFMEMYYPPTKPYKPKVALICVNEIDFFNHPKDSNKEYIQITKFDLGGGCEFQEIESTELTKRDHLYKHILESCQNRIRIIITAP